MQRFWEQAEAASVPGGFGILLDGRPVRLPGGAPLCVPGAALAEAIAAEWGGAGGGTRGGTTSWDALPLTRLVGTAQERIAPDPAAAVAGLARYGETDLLCYRAEDPGLAAEQAALWQPLLDWAALALDAPLRVTTGLIPVPQPAAALAALARQVGRRSALEVAALGVLVPALGSLVLGLAVVLDRLDVAAAHALAILDETYQEARWGLDSEAATRRGHVTADLAVAARLAVLSRE